jgi:hypothetical protein
VGMKRRGKLFTGFGIFMLLLVVFYIDTSVYPFTSQKPNFADVERVFDRMQFPAEWQEIRSSENRGIGGRRCPIESPSYCFHKGKDFRTASSIDNAIIESITRQSECVPISFNYNEPLNGESYTNFLCSSGAIELRGTFKKIENQPDMWEVSLTAYS